MGPRTSTRECQKGMIRIGDKGERQKRLWLADATVDTVQDPGVSVRFLACIGLGDAAGTKVGSRMWKSAPSGIGRRTVRDVCLVASSRWDGTSQDIAGAPMRAWSRAGPKSSRTLDSEGEVRKIRCAAGGLARVLADGRNWRPRKIRIPLPARRTGQMRKLLARLAAASGHRLS
jgi:hypothetical protein